MLKYGQLYHSLAFVIIHKGVDIELLNEMLKVDLIN